MPVEGMTELKKNIRAVKAASSTALRATATAGARPIRDWAKKIVPLRTGLARRSIRLKPRRGGVAEGRTSVGFSRAAFYLRFFERGAAPHTITAKKATRKI